MLLLQCAILLLAVAVGATNYNGYQLLELNPQSAAQRSVLMHYLRQNNFDIWREEQYWVDVLVSPTAINGLRQLLAENEIMFSVKHDNIQNAIDEEAVRMSERSDASADKAFDYNTFNNYTTILAEMDAMVLRCVAPVMCEAYSIGRSYNGESLYMLRVYREGTGRPAIWVDAALHGREWISTSTIMKMMSHLIDDWQADAEVEALLVAYDWYFLPVANPDGYIYTFAGLAGDRFWRKSRNINPEATFCRGTELNRNFNQMWGNADSSTNACDETFCGLVASSAPETQAIEDELDMLGPITTMSFHLHSYGQMWLTPFGSINTADGSCNYPADYNNMMVVANAGADAIAATYDSVWRRGSYCSMYGPGSGQMLDYSNAVAGVSHAGTIKLRGSSYIISEDQIEPAYQEAWNGIVAALAAIV